MANSNQIPFPKVDVQLLTSAKVKDFNDISIKDFFNNVLSSQDKYTNDVAEYNSQQQIVPNSKNEVGKTPKVPKFLIINNDFGASLTLIGNALICTPYAPWFNSSGCAKLKQDIYYSGGVKNNINGGSNVTKTSTSTVLKSNKTYTFTNSDGSSYTTTAKNGNDAGASLAGAGWGWYAPVADNVGNFNRDSRGNVKYAMINSSNANPFANLSAGWNFSTSREQLNPFYGSRATQSYINPVTGDAGGTFSVGADGKLVAPAGYSVDSSGQIVSLNPKSFSADTRIGSTGASFADNANSVGGFVGNLRSVGGKAQNSNSIAPVVGPGNPIKIGNSSMGLPQTGATDVSYPNTWFCSVGGFFAEAPGNDGIALINKNTALNIPLIQSNFQILDKQPFAFKFLLGPFNEFQKAEIESNLKSGDKLVDALIPKVDILWDKYQLTFRKDGKIYLSVNGKLIGKESQLPTVSIEEKSGDRGKQLTIYPLGNSLFVYSGDITTEATNKKAFVRFQLPEPYKINPSNLKLRFKTGQSVFDYSVIVHPTDGAIKSPTFSCGFAPDTKIVNLGYLWKVGAGAKPSSITFPDPNDTAGNSNYLSRHKISYSVDSAGTNKFTYTVGLKQPNQLGGADLRSLNAYSQQVFANTVNELNKVLAGQQTLNEGLANSLNYAGQNTPTDTFFNDFNINPVQDVKDSWDKLVTNFANTVLNQSYDNGADAASALTDAGYGSTAKSITTNLSASLGPDTYSSIKASKLNLIRKSIDKIITNIYSPAIYFINVTLHKNLVTANLNPNPQIDNCDVLSININQSVERLSGSITLNNRNNCESNPTQGKYTHTSSNNFCGIKPIQVKLGYEDGAFSTVFTGYVSNRKYSRPSPKTSTCTLELEDITKKCREQYACNLPFFDGWCHLAAMYYLLRECGFDDNEMRLYTNGPTLRSLLQGDPDTHTGGCFEGHIGGRPTGSEGLSGSYMHQRLPMAFVGVTEPVYNFQFGTPLWDCMQRIRNHSGWYLYGDVNGHVVYGPPKFIISDSGLTFKETSSVADMFEIQRILNIANDTTNNRNAVVVQGQTFIPNLDILKNNWGIHLHILKSPTFYQEENKVNYAPYTRMSFERNPKFEDPQATAAYAAEVYRRATREWVQAEFGAWGHPELRPYHQINIEEAVNETGATGKWVICAHSLNVDVKNLQIISQFNCENMDQQSVNFDPQSHANIRG